MNLNGHGYLLGTIPTPACRDWGRSQRTSI